MLELKLRMMGIPEEEITQITPKELQVLVHLISYMSRKKEGDM
jgi:hypothetical protein